jgi:hypothetical protein
MEMSRGASRAGIAENCKEDAAERDSSYDKASDLVCHKYRTEAQLIKGQRTRKLQASSLRGRGLHRAERQPGREGGGRGRGTEEEGERRRSPWPQNAANDGCQGKAPPRRRAGARTAAARPGGNFELLEEEDEEEGGEEDGKRLLL